MDEKKVVNLKNDWVILLFFIFLPIIFLHRGLFANNEILSSATTDLRAIFFFTRFYGFNSLKEGIIPLWNSYIFAGMPFIATLHPAIFYPLNAIFLILPINFAINYSISLHLSLSGIFMYYFLRHHGTSRSAAIIAGIVYTFSAPQIMHIYAGHLNALTSMIWTPLMFLFLGRLLKGEGYKYGVLLSIVISIQLLAGQPQYLFYSLIALFLYLLFFIFWLRRDKTDWGKIWQRNFAFIAFIILGLLISAIQILPTLEMTKYSTRGNLTYEWITSFSLPPENLITFLIPDFFGNILKIPYWGKNYLWEMTAYVGIMPLLLALIAIFYVRKRIVYFFTFLAAISLILALGKYTPLLKVLYTYIPGFNLFRGNSKFIFLNALSLAALSGFGIDAFVKGFDGFRKQKFKIEIIAISCIIVTSFLLILKIFDENWFREAINKAAYSQDFYGNWKVVLYKGFETTALANFRNCTVKTTIPLLMLGTSILLLFAYRKLSKKAFITSVFAIIIFDLFSFGIPYMVSFDSKELYWNNEIISFLRQDKDPFRIIAPEMEVNSGMVPRIETLGGHDAMMIKRYSEFINFSQGNRPDMHILWVNITHLNKLTDLLNAKYLLLSSDKKVDIPSFVVVFDNGCHCIYRNRNVLPRAFIVHNTKIIKDRDNIFKEMISPEFNPVSYAIIEEELGVEYALSNKSTNQNSVVNFIQYSPNKVTMEVHLKQPGLLILGDVYYPGWKVYVDNKIDKIYRANYVMRAVYLKEGNHTVRFIYDPLLFKVGLIITLLTLLTIFIYFIRRKNT